MVKSVKPGCIQSLVSESAMEALHMPVLHGPPGRDVDQVDPVVLRTAHHAPRGELGSVV
jgi:hypothetical protein